MYLSTTKTASAAKDEYDEKPKTVQASCCAIPAGVLPSPWSGIRHSLPPLF
ncbi:MAG: hypothetical protein ACLVGX_02235 [Oscillospiraceae bacterium]